MDTNNSLIKLDNVLLYDGVCKFCNASVHFVLKKEKKPFLRFMALQSESGQRVLQNFGYERDYAESILYLSNGQLYSKSDAALKVAGCLKSPYSFLTALVILPRVFRNFFYDILARNRYKWFGKYDTCAVPSPEVRVRFLE